MNTLPSPLLRRLTWCKWAARLSLGLVWLYEGIIPKILFPAAHPEQTALVLRTGLYWGSPEQTLYWLGIAQAITGLVLLTGWVERRAVALASAGMGVLIVLVIAGRPSMVTDPFGAIAKDACLFACALIVWLLSPVLRRASAPS